MRHLSFLLAFISCSTLAQDMNAYLPNYNFLYYGPSYSTYGYPQVAEYFDFDSYQPNKEIISYDQDLRVQSIHGLDGSGQNMMLTNFSYHSSGKVSDKLTRKWINNSWVLSDLTKYQFDSHGNVIEMLLLTYNSNTAQWDTSYQGKYAFYYDGNRITELDILAKDSAGNWYPNIRSLYQYDSNSDCILYSEYHYPSSVPTHFRYYFQSNRMLDSAHYYSYDSNGNEYIYLKQYNFTYDTWNGEHFSSKLSSYSELQFYSGHYRPHQWTITNYVNNSYDCVRVFWENNMWVNYRHYVATFDEHNNLQLRIMDKGESNYWWRTNGTEYINTYDSEDHLTDRICKEYDGSYVPNTSAYSYQWRIHYSSFLDPLSVKEKTSEPILIYPNPATTGLFVKSKQGAVIYNETGSVLLSVKADQSYIDLHDFKPGVYFIRSFADNTFQKFVVAR
jgi:hypothetical protein